MTHHRPAEEKFYSRYAWCLNPILSVRDLLSRFNQELDAYHVFEGWQREEVKINLYLFACAVACTIDDYFNLSFINFSPIGARLPRLKPVLRAADWVVNTPASLLRISAHWQAWQFRKDW